MADCWPGLEEFGAETSLTGTVDAGVILTSMLRQMPQLFGVTR